MVIVFPSGEADSDGFRKVTRVHYRPEMLAEGKKARGIELPDEKVEEPEVGEYESARLYVSDDGEVDWRIEKRPGVEPFMDALDVELGRKTVRALLREYPDVERALSMGRYARGWVGLGDAREDGAVDAETLDTIERLAEEYGIPKPDDG